MRRSRGLAAREQPRTGLLAVLTGAAESALLSEVQTVHDDRARPCAPLAHVAYGSSA
jgi:hypothetical protein